MTGSAPESNGGPPSSLSPPHAGDTPGTPRPGCWTPVTIMVLSGVLLVATFAGLLVGRCSAPDPKPAASVTTIRTGPSVITAIRDLARLETSQYHIERVIDLTETQKRFFGLVEVQDALLLVAAGDVIAGVDLAELRDEDVVIDNARSSIEITLPPAKILSTRLDNQRTYVHTRRTDALAQRRENLETQARQRAEQTLSDAAKEGAILERADANAAKTIEHLARAFGYREVRVRARANFDERKHAPR